MKTAKKSMRPSLYTVFGAFIILLALYFMTFGMLFARYKGVTETDAGARVARFAPTASYGTKWQDSLTLSSPDGISPVTLPFTVDNSDTEVNTSLTVTVTHSGLLPLSISLYACEEAELSTATPLPIAVSSLGETTFVLEQAALTESAFTLVVSWEGTHYEEFYAGLTETLTLGVVCEQLD